MNWGHLFFNFSARINRAKYWIAMLIYSAIYIVLAIVGYATDNSAIYQAINGMLNIVISHLEPRRRRKAPARPQQVRLVSGAVLYRARHSDDGRHRGRHDHG